MVTTMKETPSDEKVLEDLGAPVPSIPDLKKKDKERKRTGAVWSGARPGAGSFTGATGGSGAAGVEIAGGAAQSAAGAAGTAGGAGAFGGASGAAGAAAPGGLGGWLANLAGSSGWLGGANASFLSKAMIAIGAASLIAGVGLYAFLRLHAKPASSSPELGPITDTIKVRRNPDDERLRMAAQAGHGQFMLDDTAAPAAETPGAEDKTPPTDKAVEKPANNPWADILSGFRPQNFGSQSIAGLPSGSAGDIAGPSIFSSLTGSGAHGGLGRACLRCIIRSTTAIFPAASPRARRARPWLPP